jgi:hypothetical protein
MPGVRWELLSVSGTNRAHRCARLLILVLALSLSSGCLADEMPSPDAQGEYGRRTLHTRWQVVDADPQGLNGRLAENFPRLYDDARQPWPTTEVLTWPVVERFPKGRILEAVTGNVGVMLIKETSGRTWMMVRRSDGGVCFVRANHRFLRPVK